jgi:predicted nuclease of predicted toxin-antitoxin system
VKLLLDENLSDRIVHKIADVFPESAHVKTHGLVRTSDTLIWSFAKKNGFTIVSKDADFHHRSLVLGQPPKLIFLRIGNCPTDEIIRTLRTNSAHIRAFDADPSASILVLPA